MIRLSTTFFGVQLFLLCLAGTAEAKTIGVLEYRAGVHSAPEMATVMAQELGRLTSHTAVSPAEARLRLGAQADAAVARCEGAPQCIARLGARLGCDEVILVGLSQLGDLILAIQRIRVSDGQVLARMAESLRRGQRVDQSKMGVFLRRLLPPSDFKRYGWIVVHTDIHGDQLFLDETLRGETPLPPIRVPAPGTYTVRVTRPGFEDFIAKLDILPEAKVEVTPTLSRKAEPLAWYQRWWVWAIVGGVVAAGTTAAVVGTVAQGEQTVPAVVHLPE